MGWSLAQSVSHPVSVGANQRFEEYGLSPLGSTIVKFGKLTLIWNQADYNIVRHRSEEDAARTFRYLLGDTR